MSISVDGTAAGAPLEPIWAFHGYDELNYTTTTEGEALLRTLAEIHSAKVRVRTHFLFNTGDGEPALKWGSTNLYTEDSAGNPLYSYTLIDEITDVTLAAGVLPMVELGFMPQALSSRPDPYQNSNPYLLDGGCFYPPRDYARWSELVRTWVDHVKQRYPDAEASWLWELWNEPDIGYWQGTFEEYTKLYDYTEAALHSVMPEAVLGGPAVARPGGAFLSRFLEHCATGINAVSGERGTRLDLVSFHAKGGVILHEGQVRMDLGNQLDLHRAGFDSVAGSSFAQRPVVISEADPDGCAACPVSTAPHHAYRNSPAYGAYVVAMLKRTLDLAAEREIDLRGVLSWAFTFPDSDYFEGYRALSTHGIHLPILNAFKLLGGLGGNRLPLVSSGALGLSEILTHSVREQPDLDALAARQGQHIQVLVWNYHDDLVPSEPTQVELEVAMPADYGAHAQLIHTRVDAEHGDAFSVWLAQGSPASPSAAQLTTLRESMEPVVLNRTRLPVTRGAVRIRFELPRFGISLVSLMPAPPRPSERVTKAQSGAACSLGRPWSARYPATTTGGLWLLCTLVRRLRRKRRRAHTPG